MSVPAFPALEAVEKLIAALVRQNRWTTRYALDIVEQDVFSAVGHMMGVNDLISAYGQQVVEEAVRSLRQ